MGVAPEATDDSRLALTFRADALTGIRSLVSGAQYGELPRNGFGVGPRHALGVGRGLGQRPRIDNASRR